MADADQHTVDAQLRADAGDVFLKLDQKDEAMRAYTSAIALHPFYAFYSSRGWTYHLQGNEGHAILDLPKAVEMNPNDPYAYGMRGSVFESAGNRVAAIIDYRKAVTLSSNYTAPREALARLGVAP